MDLATIAATLCGIGLLVLGGRLRSRAQARRAADARSVDAAPGRAARSAPDEQAA